MVIYKLVTKERYRQYVMDISQSVCLCFRYCKELSIPHFPDMVFPKNILELTHNSGAKINFNPLDALKCVSSTVEAIEVSCAEAWQEARCVL